MHSIDKHKVQGNILVEELPEKWWILIWLLKAFHESHILVGLPALCMWLTSYNLICYSYAVSYAVSYSYVCADKLQENKNFRSIWLLNMIEMMLSTLFSIPSNVKPGGAEDPWHWDVSLSRPLCPPLPLLQKTIPLSPHQHLGTSFETFPSRLWCHLKSPSTKATPKIRLTNIKMNTRDKRIEKEHDDNKSQHCQAFGEQNPVWYPVLWERKTQLIYSV